MSSALRRVEEERSISQAKLQRQSDEMHVLLADNGTLRVQLKQTSGVIEAAEARMKQLKVQSR